MTYGQSNAVLLASAILVALGQLFRYLRLPPGSAERRDARRGVFASVVVVPFCWWVLYGRQDAASVSTVTESPDGAGWFALALMTAGVLFFLPQFALAVLRGIVYARRRFHF